MHWPTAEDPRLVLTSVAPWQQPEQASAVLDGERGQPANSAHTVSRPVPQPPRLDTMAVAQPASQGSMTVAQPASQGSMAVAQPARPDTMAVAQPASQGSMAVACTQGVGGGQGATEMAGPAPGPGARPGARAVAGPGPGHGPEAGAGTGPGAPPSPPAHGGGLRQASVGDDPEAGLAEDEKDDTGLYWRELTPGIYCVTLDDAWAHDPTSQATPRLHEWQDPLCVQLRAYERPQCLLLGDPGCMPEPGRGGGASCSEGVRGGEAVGPCRVSRAAPSSYQPGGPSGTEGGAGLFSTLSPVPGTAGPVPGTVSPVLGTAPAPQHQPAQDLGRGQSEEDACGGRGVGAGVAEGPRDRRPGAEAEPTCVHAPRAVEGAVVGGTSGERGGVNAGSPPGCPPPLPLPLFPSYGMPAGTEREQSIALALLTQLQRAVQVSTWQAGVHTLAAHAARG